MRASALVLVLLLGGCGAQRALASRTAADEAVLDRLRADLGGRSIDFVAADGTGVGWAERVAQRLGTVGFETVGPDEAVPETALVVEVAGPDGGPLHSSGELLSVLPLPVVLGPESMRLRVRGARVGGWQVADTIGATAYGPVGLLLFSLVGGWNSWALYKPVHWSDATAEHLALALARALEASAKETP